MAMKLLRRFGMLGCRLGLHPLVYEEWSYNAERVVQECNCGRRRV